MFRVFPDMTGFARQWSWFANHLWIIAMFEKNLNVSLTTPKKKRKYPIYPEIPGNTQEYPEIPESKKDTRKYPIVFFNTPTRPEPDPLPGIFSNTRPDPILKTLPVGHWLSVELLRAAIYHGGWYTTYINQHWVQRRTIDMSISTSPIMQHHKIWPLFILIVRENAAYQISCISVEFWPNNEDIRHLHL